jgi:hypothetical protein
MSGKERQKHQGRVYLPRELATNLIMAAPQGYVIIPHTRDPSVIKAVEEATIFTRLGTSHTLEQLTAAIEETPKVSQAFCIHLRGTVIVYGKDKMKHRGHVGVVLHIFAVHGLKAVFDECVFEARDAAAAGFRFEKVEREGEQALMVVDLGLPGAGSA